MGDVDPIVPNVPEPAHGLAPLPKDAVKPGVFRGETAADCKRAKLFVKKQRNYFACYPDSYPDTPLGLIRRFTVLEASCFPEGTHAAYWWDANRARCETYEAFEQAFIAHFAASGADLVTLHEQWDELHQKATVHQYYSELMRTAAAIEALDHPFSEEVILLKFVTGLKPYIRKDIRRDRYQNPDMTLNVLMNSAAQYERAANHSAQRLRPDIPANRPQLRGFDAQQRRKPRFKCFYCKSNEHEASQCPHIARKKANGTWRDRSDNARRGA